MAAAQMQRSMLLAGHGGTAALHRGAPAVSMARLGEEHTSSVMMTQPYLDYLGFGWKHRGGCPHARRCSGESTTALVVVFCTGEATIHSNIMP